MTGKTDIDVKKLMKLDLYNILGVDITATDNEIRKAYKKRALKCHPDKNPDNPDAAAEFVKLTQALEVLSDVAARAAYDAFIRAKQATAERYRHLDTKRKRMKEDLEARENAAKSKEEASRKPATHSDVNKAHQKDAAKLLEQEIERLRKEGSRLVDEEQEKLRKQMREDAAQLCADSDIGARLRVKWTCDKSDRTNGGYSEENLRSIFSCYGEVTTLVVSKKKSGSAIVEFDTHQNAAAAVVSERGRADNPLAVSWLSSPPQDSGSPTPDQLNRTKAPVSSPVSTRTTDTGFSDFESLVMMKLRQAEERKRLAQEIAQEDEASTNE